MRTGGNEYVEYVDAHGRARFDDSQPEQFACRSTE